MVWFGVGFVLLASVGLVALGQPIPGIAGIAIVGALSTVLALDFRRRFAVLAGRVRSVSQEVQAIRQDIAVVRETVAPSAVAQSKNGALQGVARKTGSDRLPKPSESDELVASGAFDAEYYSAQIDRTFSSELAAAEHFVRYGARAGISFHPLLEVSYLPSGIRDAYREGRVPAVLKHLTGVNSRSHLWSPAFDASVLDPERRGQGILLDRFRPNAKSAIPVPANAVGQVLPWIEFRTEMIAHARRVAKIQASRQNFRHSSWDPQVERAWIESHPLPPESGDDGVPVVSIIMPVWNRASVVGRAIESVQAQTYRSWELIVVDDGSTDGTPEVIERVAEADARIRLLRYDHGGVSAARNAGIEAARGRYLAFLDSDNTWRPSFLGLMASGLEEPGVRAAYSATHLHGSRDEYTGQSVTMLQMLIRNYVDLNVLVVETEVVRRVGGFDTKLRRWVDYDLALKVLGVAEIVYFPFIGCDYVDDDSADRITRRESQNWVHAAVSPAVTQWSELDESPLESPLAVVVRAGVNVFDTVATVRSVIIENGVAPESVLVVDDMEHSRNSIKLRAHLGLFGQVRVIKLPRSYPSAICASVARKHLLTPLILFVSAGIELRPGSVEALGRSASMEGVAATQPLLTDKAGVVISAGLADNSDGSVVELARGLTIDDVRQLSLRAVDALAPSVFAIKTASYDAAGGPRAIFSGDAGMIDLHRRLRRSGDRVEVCVDAIAVDRRGDVRDTSIALDGADIEWLAAPRRGEQVDHWGLYEPLGLAVAGLASGIRGALDAPFTVYSQSSSTGTSTRGLRWAIKIGAPFTVGGDRWGDVPFAASIAGALRSHGHDAVVDRHGAFSRPTNYLDDVVLVIRGAEPCTPQPGKVNMIWVISRPERVTRQEIEAFDVVFVASKAWCEHVRTKWGINAIFLPQATNPSLFRAKRADEYDGEIDVLFVGGPRPPVGRKIVADCLALGYEVKVVGPRWANYVPERMILADSLPNDEVAALYASSRIVLNDHWDDMARLGFVNNRLYDIVACGARAISDNVDSIDELFMGAVRTYGSLDELASLLRTDGEFPDENRIKEIAEHVRSAHSFEARALTLIGEAERLLDR